MCVCVSGKEKGADESRQLGLEECAGSFSSTSGTIQSTLNKEVGQRDSVGYDASLCVSVREQERGVGGWRDRG